jgi:predicted enzyme related to lactoylglutathione lyase
VSTSCQNKFLAFVFRDLSQPGELMAKLQKSTAVAPTDPNRLDLFMTVMKIANWSAIVPWYIDTLGLVPVLLDAEHEFAFLAAGNGRLGLQGTKTARAVDERSKVRLVFQVRDVDAERLRLIERGVVVSMPIDNRKEGYREVRLHDPEGNTLTLFAWIDSERENPFARDRRSVEGKTKV